MAKSKKPTRKNTPEKKPSGEKPAGKNSGGAKRKPPLQIPPALSQNPKTPLAIRLNPHRKKTKSSGENHHGAKSDWS